jgi:hypothetical protein
VTAMAGGTETLLERLHGRTLKPHEKTSGFLIFGVRFKFGTTQKQSRNANYTVMMFGEKSKQ